MNFGDLTNQIVPLFTQTQFWITVGLTTLIWYGVAVGFAHILFGAGNRAPVASARQGMWLSLLLLFVGLALATYFLFRPADLVYMIAVSVTFLILTILVVAIFSKLGVEK